MLRLVHPAPPAQPRPRKHHPAAALFLTGEEARHAKAALRNLCLRHGWKALAEAMGVPLVTLHAATSARSRPTLMLYYRAAQAAKVSLEALLSGKVGLADRCPSCGGKS